MNPASGRSGRAFPVEDFVQALTAQLDRAQDALALKARTGRPLTFALKDLAIDLQVFWETDPSGRLMMRHAGPNEAGASSVHLAFTTITRSMVEENTLSLNVEEDPRGLAELRVEGVDDDERRRLEFAGVRTVGQLRRLSQGTDPRTVAGFAGIGVEKLRSLLEQSSRPAVSSHDVVVRPDGRRLLRVRGANLSDGVSTEVLLDGEPVEVLEASPTEVLVRPLSHHDEGALEVRVGGHRATGWFRLPPVPESLRRAPRSRPLHQDPLEHEPEETP